MASRNGDGAFQEQARQMRRLLQELYRQRKELGDIATELISLLEAAGVRTTDGPDNRPVGSQSS
jgi:hypothetical protein